MRTLRTPRLRRLNRRPGHSLLTPVVLGAALLLPAAPASAATPAAAGPTTWHVGPNAPAARTRPAALSPQAPSTCARPDTRSIQSAVDASGPGDTIIVCDGTYRGGVVIEGHRHDGLTLVGATSWGATLVTRLDARIGALFVVSEADGVTVADLRFRGRPTCTTVTGVAIAVVDARGVDVRSNQVLGGAASLANSCGFLNAIVVQESTGVVRWNRVENWLAVGIVVDMAPDATGTVRVVGNSLRYAPSAVPPVTAQFGILTGTQSDDVRFIVERNVVTVDPAIKGTRTNPSLVFGIIVASSHARISGNRSTGSGIALTANGLGSGIVVTRNHARGLIRDCQGDASQEWSGNDGRIEKSDPTGICAPPA